jgi:hypothetical protein
MKSFKEYRVDEAADKVQAILEKTKVALNKLVNSTPIDYEIEAFLMFSLSYGSHKEALEDLENLGSFSFQNSPDDKWDEEGYEGPEYADITWGDLADLDLGDIKKYEKAMAKGESKERIEKIIKQIDDIDIN